MYSPKQTVKVVSAWELHTQVVKNKCPQPSPNKKPNVKLTYLEFTKLYPTLVDLTKLYPNPQRNHALGFSSVDWEVTVDMNLESGGNDARHFHSCPPKGGYLS